MPSLFPETFGYVVLEAFAVRTPVVVHRGGGAIAETGVASGGGLGYETDAEMLVALRRVVHDDASEGRTGGRRVRDATGRLVRRGAPSGLLRPDPGAAGVGRARARRTPGRPGRVDSKAVG